MKVKKNFKMEIKQQIVLPKKWNSLDLAAKANLKTKHQLDSFQRYKEELFTDGEEWDGAEDILRGYIWSEICLLYTSPSPRDS